MREIFAVTDNRENFLTAKISRYTVYLLSSASGKQSVLKT